MREIHDEESLEYAFRAQQGHFGTRPPLIRLLMFEKGELLTHPLKPLDQFLIVMEGRVTIYDEGFLQGDHLSGYRCVR